MACLLYIAINATCHVLLCTQDASVSDASREVQYVDMVLQESLRLYPPGARYSGEVRACKL